MAIVPPKTIFSQRAARETCEAAVGTAAASLFCILFRRRTYCNVLISTVHSHQSPRKIFCSWVRMSRCLGFLVYLWTQSRNGFRLQASQGRSNSLLSSKFQTFSSSSSCSARMLCAAEATSGNIISRWVSKYSEKAPSLFSHSNFKIYTEN